jgi:hypothetical protein
VNPTARRPLARKAIARTAACSICRMPAHPSPARGWRIFWCTCFRRASCRQTRRGFRRSIRFASPELDLLAPLHQRAKNTCHSVKRPPTSVSTWLPHAIASACRRTATYCDEPIWLPTGSWRTSLETDHALLTPDSLVATFRCVAPAPRSAFDDERGVVAGEPGAAQSTSGEERRPGSW